MYRETDLEQHKVWTHKKGGLYIVQGVVECSSNGREAERSVLYFSVTYQQWKYREVSEFLDGRFTPVPAPTCYEVK